MIYLATPYTSADPFLMQKRFELAEAITAACIIKHLPVFSPIVHCHELAIRHELPKDFTFWQHYCLDMLHAADLLWVIKLPGWSESKGVASEIAYAKQQHITTEFKEATWRP